MWIRIRIFHYVAISSSSHFSRQFIDDASISSPSRPIYAMLISREVESKQEELNDDGMTAEERQQIKAEKEAAQVRKQVEADLGGFDMEQEWVEEIEREECYEIDGTLGLAPPMAAHKFELWLVDASSEWAVLDKYELDDHEHGTALKVLYLTDVSAALIFSLFCLSSTLPTQS
jgi:cleavage and polyadenylation specificity factor subunit 1